MIFERFPAFLYMDLHKGMAAVNLLRCCRPCGRGSLAIGGDDICCCERGAGHRRQDLQADGRRQTGEGEAKDGDGCRGAARKKRYERVELTGGQSPDAEGRIRHPADHAGRVCTETECAVRAGKHRRSVPFWDRPLQLIREPLLGILKKRRPQSPCDSELSRIGRRETYDCNHPMGHRFGLPSRSQLCGAKYNPVMFRMSRSSSAALILSAEER